MKHSRTGIVALALFVLMASTGCKHRLDGEDSDTQFDTGEHAMLGDKGYANACASTSGCPAKITGGSYTYSYGKLVAFSGDFTEDYHELLNPPKPSSGFSLSNMLGASSIDALNKIVAQEECGIQGGCKLNPSDQKILVGQMKSDSAAYVDGATYDNMGAALYAQYVLMANRNQLHFGWYNMKNYVDFHGQAIALALQAHAAKDKTKAAALLNEALFANGYADHFLTDAFAAGHVRVPRKDTIDWWLKKHSYFSNGAGILSRIQHDSDPCRLMVDENNPCHEPLKKGTQIRTLRVANSNGDHWETRGDSDLFRGASFDDIFIKMPVDAVEASVVEVLDAYTSGKEPKDVYAAARLVPFPADDETPISEVYARNFSDEEIQAFFDSIGPLGNEAVRVPLSVTFANTRDFFKHMPDIMKAFRDNVAMDIDKGRGNDAKRPLDLKKRLPAAYLEAFKKAN